MENRERHLLEKQYVHETQNYLQLLREGVTLEQLTQQKKRVLDLSRQLDHRSPGVDPSSRQLRHHPGKA